MVARWCCLVVCLWVLVFNCLVGIWFGLIWLVLCYMLVWFVYVVCLFRWFNLVCLLEVWLLVVVLGGGCWLLV